jgi:hypothetical protein
MSARVLVAVLFVLMLAPASASAGPSATSESGSPINDQGSSYHYRTYITSITPPTHGLSVEVLEFADRLLLRNHTGQTVTVYGYSGEPYARVLANGTTEQNVRSPAVYLNTNFYANVTVPASASASAPPKWEVVDRTGELEWHDHRIHWMSPTTPPEVKNTGKKTKIFGWTVPIAVGTQRGSISGELYWVPESSSVSAGAIAVLVVIVLGGGAIVLVVRKRRGGGGGSVPAHADPEAKEAW